MNSILDPEVVASVDQINPTLSSAFGKVWDLHKTRSEPFNTDLYRVYGRGYTNPQVTIQGTTGANWDLSSATTDLPVSAGTIDRLTIGHMLLVEDEIVVVKSVDRTANTISVYERGAGETTPAAHGTAAITAAIVGNAHEEGKVDPEAMAEESSYHVNACQLVEEAVEMTYEDANQPRTYGKTEQQLKSEAMLRVMRNLARNAIYGVYRAPAQGFPGMSRGVLQWLGLAGGIQTAVGDDFDESVLLDALTLTRTSGGNVNAIVMSVGNKQLFNQFTGAGVTAVQKDANSRSAGRILDVYLAEGFGEIPIVVDLDWPVDKIALVDTSRMFKGWKANDQLRFEKEPANSRQVKETLQGKFSHYIEGVGQLHHLVTDLG